MSKRLSLALVVVALCGSLYLPMGIAHACSPGGPNPWFVAMPSFKSSSLPPGVVIDNDGTSEASIRNESSTPLYLIENFNNGATFPNTELPGTVRPTFKLVHNRAYEYDYFTNTYTLYSGPIRSEIEIQTPIPAEDNRPSDVSAPNDESFSFTAYYGSQLVTISGVTRFTLNQSYDPHAGYKGGRACSQLNSFNTALFLLMYFVLPLLAVSLVIWQLLRWREKRVASKGDSSPQ